MKRFPLRYYRVFVCVFVQEKERNADEEEENKIVWIGAMKEEN